MIEASETYPKDFSVDRTQKCHSQKQTEVYQYIVYSTVDYVKHMNRTERDAVRDILA